MAATLAPLRPPPPPPVHPQRHDVGHGPSCRNPGQPMAEQVKVQVRRSGLRFGAAAVLDLAADVRTVREAITDCAGLPRFMPGIRPYRMTGLVEVKAALASFPAAATYTVAERKEIVVIEAPPFKEQTYVHDLRLRDPTRASQRHPRCFELTFPAPDLGFWRSAVCRQRSQLRSRRSRHRMLTPPIPTSASVAPPRPSPGSCAAPAPGTARACSGPGRPA